MTETVLTDKGKLKIAQAVHYGSLGVMDAITLTEIAVLQSPEVVALRQLANVVAAAADDSEEFEGPDGLCAAIPLDDMAAINDALEAVQEANP